LVKTPKVRKKLPKGSRTREPPVRRLRRVETTKARIRVREIGFLLSQKLWKEKKKRRKKKRFPEDRTKNWSNQGMASKRVSQKKKAGRV